MSRQDPLIRWARVIAPILAAGLLVWICVLAPYSPPNWEPDYIPAHYTDPGEALLHGTDPSDATVWGHMPLANVTAAWLLSPDRTSSPLAWKIVTLGLAAVMVVALGATLATAGCAWLALMLFGTPSIGGGPGIDWTFPQTCYSVLVSLSACVLVWRARAPSPARSAALGAALGATLIFRSPLVFFPPLLALYELGAVYRWSVKRAWKVLLPLCLLPYAFLLPTTGMNLGLGNGFVPLESGSQDINMVAGALGLIPGLGGEPYGLVPDDPMEDEGPSPGRWAVREVLRHPIRYAGAFLARLQFAMTFRPLLFSLAFFSIWLWWKRLEFRELGLMSAYFLTIYCMLAIIEEYFVPLWPILAATGACGLLPLARWAIRPSPSERPGRRDNLLALAALAGGAAAAWLARDPHLSAIWAWAGAAAAVWLVRRSRFPAADTSPARTAVRRVLAAFLAAAMLASAYSAVTVAAYTLKARRRDPGSIRALDEAVQRSPDSAWLRIQRARLAMAEGRTPDAVSDYSKALGLRPSDPELRLELAWSLMRAGLSGALVNFRPSLDSSDVNSEDFGRMISQALTARSVLARASGDPGSARDLAREAWRVWSRDCMGLGRVETAFERTVIGQARLPSRFLKSALDRWTHLLAPEDRAALARDLHAVEPRDSDLLLKLAELEEAVGRKDAAAAAAMAADDLKLRRSYLHRKASLLIRLEKHERACETADSALIRFPDREDLWIDLAVCSEALGRVDETRRALKRAEDAGLRKVRQAAGLYAEIGDHEDARRLYRSIGLEPPSEEGPPAEVPQEPLPPPPPNSPEESVRRLLRDTEDPERALAKLDELLPGLPKAPGPLLLRAELLAALGRKEEASRSLEEALGLEPSPEERLRLAELRQRWGDCLGAIAALAPLTSGNGPSPLALRDKGICEFLTGSPDRAVRDLEAAVALAPGLLSAYLSLGAVHESRGEPEKALALYERASRQEPMEGERVKRPDIVSAIERLSGRPKTE